MKKLAITAMVFTVLSVVLTGWMVYTVKHEVPAVKVTVIKLADIKTDAHKTIQVEGFIGRTTCISVTSKTPNWDEGENFATVAAMFL